jgi:hypothetical protein
MDFSKFTSDVTSGNPAAMAAAVLKSNQPAADTTNVVNAPQRDTTNVVKPPESATDKAPEGDKPPEGDEKPENKDPLSPKFAALAKRETQLVKRDKELKAREAALQEKESKLGSWEQREAERKKEVEQNPLKALEYWGLTYKDLTEFVLNGETPTPDSQVKVLETRLSEFEKKAEEQRKAEDEAKKKADESEHEETITQFRKSCETFVTENAETYELINLYGGTPVVLATIEQYFQSTHDPDAGKVGKVLSFKEACELVEKYYEDEAKKLERTKKFAKASPEPKQDPTQDPPAPSRTLNNNMSSSAPSLLPAKTENDRMARALAALDKRS